MPVLTRSQKLFSGLKMFGNFIERPLRVGDIVLNDDGQHLIWGNIEDVIDGFSLEGKTQVSNKADLKFTNESNIDVTIGGQGSGTIAEGEIGLKFNSSKSAFVSLRQIQRTSVSLGLVDEKLKEYWKQKGFNKKGNINVYQFIAETIYAESGTVIFSQDKKNSVVLKGKGGPLGSLADVASGNVEIQINTKSTLEIISATPIQPLYTAVMYKSNGNFEIVG